MTETSMQTTNHRVEQLVKMLNQIAENTPRKQNPEETAEAVAGHVLKFWAKGMKADIKVYAAGGGEGLSELALKAVGKL